MKILLTAFGFAACTAGLFAADTGVLTFPRETIGVPPLTLSEVIGKNTLTPRPLQFGPTATLPKQLHAAPKPPSARKPPQTRMPIVEPNPNIDFKIVSAPPDPDIDFKIAVKDPEADRVPQR